MTTKLPEFYVYILSDPRDDQPFYVGKGTRLRFRAHESEARTGNDSINKAKCDFIRTIWDAGMNVKYTLYPCDDEMGAMDMEQQLIEQYGRRVAGTGTLFNVDKGGRNRWRPKTSNKTVHVYDVSGELRYTFPSAKKAAEFFGCDPSIISSRSRANKVLNDTWLLSYDTLSPSLAVEHINSAKPAKRRVHQCDVEWNHIHTFDSAAAASRAMGVNISTIYTTVADHMSGKRKTPLVKGFFWKFAD